MGRWGFKDNKVRSPACCFVIHPMSGSHASLWCIYIVLYVTFVARDHLHWAENLRLLHDWE